jgi:hypothetical protein
MMDRAQWSVTTVSYFFSALPWRGSVIAPSPNQQQSIDFRLLSVKDFFASITWNGQPQFAPAPDQGQGLSYQMSLYLAGTTQYWRSAPDSYPPV